MARTTHAPFPSVRSALQELGENIRLARERRQLTATMVSERAGISRPTLVKVERGEGGVTLGAYAAVLHALGLERDLGRVAKDDELGRKLQDLQMTERRPRKRRKQGEGPEESSDDP